MRFSSIPTDRASDATLVRVPIKKKKKKKKGRSLVKGPKVLHSVDQPKLTKGQQELFMNVNTGKGTFEDDKE